MKRTLIAAALVCAANAAYAGNPHYRSYCGWQQGVYVCESRYESDYSTSTMLCGSGGYDAACSGVTKYKEPPKPKPELPTVIEVAPYRYDEADEFAKIARRHASGYRDPAGTTSLCAAPHRMTADGCK
jgi:hypothetical protein